MVTQPQQMLWGCRWGPLVCWYWKGQLVGCWGWRCVAVCGAAACLLLCVLTGAGQREGDREAPGQGTRWDVCGCRERMRAARPAAAGHLAHVRQVPRLWHLRPMMALRWLTRGVGVRGWWIVCRVRVRGGLMRGGHAAGWLHCHLLRVWSRYGPRRAGIWNGCCLRCCSADLLSRTRVGWCRSAAACGPGT